MVTRPGEPPHHTPWRVIANLKDVHVRLDDFHNSTRERTAERHLPHAYDPPRISYGHEKGRSCEIQVTNRQLTTPRPKVKGIKLSGKKRSSLPIIIQYNKGIHSDKYRFNNCQKKSNFALGQPRSKFLTLISIRLQNPYSID